MGVLAGWEQQAVVRRQRLAVFQKHSFLTDEAGPLWLRLAATASDAAAVAVAAAVRAKVDQQAKPQPKPVQAYDAPWEDDQIRQGRPRHENGAYQRPDPVGPGEMERPDIGAEGELEAHRIYEPPDQNSEPWTEQEYSCDETARGFLLLAVHNRAV